MPSNDGQENARIDSNQHAYFERTLSIFHHEKSVEYFLGRKWRVTHIKHELKSNGPPKDELPWLLVRWESKIKCQVIQ